MSRGSKASVRFTVLRADTAADAAAVATVKDHREMNSLVQGGVEDAGHLAVADIVTAFVCVGGDQRAVCMDILAVYQHGELVALAVDAQRAVTGVIKHHGVALLWHVHKILLHGGEDAVASGLRGRQDNNSGPRLRWSRIGEHNHLVRRESRTWD